MKMPDSQRTLNSSVRLSKKCRNPNKHQTLFLSKTAWLQSDHNEINVTMPLGYQDLLYFFQSFLTAFLSLEDGTDQPIRAGFFFSSYYGDFLL